MKYVNILLIGILLTGFSLRESDIFHASAKDSKLTWAGKRVNYGHYGSVDLLSGELEFEGDDLLGGEFVIDMKSIRDLDMDDEKRSGRLAGHLKSEDFFDVENYPKALFAITSVKKEKTDNGNYILTGLLTVRGKTNTESFNAQIDRDGNTVTAKGKVVFDRTKYDVKYGSGSFFDDLGDKMIHNNIELDVEIVAYK